MPISDALIDRTWDDDIVPQITEYIRVPGEEPALRPRLGAQRPHRRGGAPGRGLGAAAAGQGPRGRDGPAGGPHAGAVLRGARSPGGRGDATVLLYGHLDKQPEMPGWRDGFGPWIPVMEDGRLYGRGGADDGYAVFASLTAIAALQAAG